MISLGDGNSDKATILIGSGLTPLALTMRPANGNSVPIANFFLDRTMSNSRHFHVMILILSHKVGKSLAHTSMSSTIFFANERPSSALSEWRHHSTGEEDNPI